MLDNKLINEVFNNLISIITSGIEEQYIEEVRKNYLKKLNNRYEDKRITEDNYNKYLNNIIEIEKNEWLQISAFQKKQLLIIDDNLNQIIYISNEGFKLARDKKTNNNTISKEYAFEQIKKLEELLPNVYDFNIGVAKKYISEAILDYNYAVGDTDKRSFRLI